MSSTKEDITSEGVQEQAGAMMGRLFEAGLGFMELITVFIGERLGLYRILADGGPATPRELASRAAIDERYAREWLEQQAATEFLGVDDVAKAADERRYSISAGNAAALADRDSPFYIAYFGRFVPGIAGQAPAVAEAFRSGGGVSWSAFGSGVIEAQGDYNRAWLLGALGTQHLPAVADVDARLQADPPARVLDVACGAGWASIAVAEAYPNVTVDGVDSDESSIALARKNAAEHGVGDRVRFEVKDGASVGSDGPYDLAIIIESVHDMSNPVDVLSGVHQSLVPGGTLIVADEKVDPTFSAPGGMGERFCYASSVTLCLPAARSGTPSAAIGAVMRPETFRRLTTEAGFGDVRILDEIEHEALRFYRSDR